MEKAHKGLEQLKKEDAKDDLALLMAEIDKQRKELENNMRDKKELQQIRAEIQTDKKELVETEMQRQIKDSTQLREETENNLRQKTMTMLPKRDHLEKIGQEARTESEEIEEIKCRFHEIKEHLEERLVVIQRHELVQRTRIQRENEELKKMTAELERGSQTLQREWDRGRRKLQDKDQELEMRKVEMFREIERLQVNIDKETETLKTSDKRIQTSDVVLTIEEERLWLIEEHTVIEDAPMSVVGAEAAPPGFSRALRWYVIYLVLFV
ncbi:unnamed protein product [Coregonus sp. 'balchen']|nr:unnamed protein product [Coregonus sp. 'balchen']